MTHLRFKDIIILALLNLALLVGAGNIIFPPFIGYMSGSNILHAAAGFFLTGVGLPVFTAVVMGLVDGSIVNIVRPLGLKMGTLLIVVCYLCAGPLGAIPRAATVAYSLAFQPFVPDASYAWIYYVSFFVIVVAVALHPHRLFEILGQVLTPIKIIAIVALCASAFSISINYGIAPHAAYVQMPFFEGLKQGYLTLDTFGALIFGVIMVNAVRSRGVEKASHVAFYIFTSGTLAGLGLMFIYFCLFRVGNGASHLVSHPASGADILCPYIAAHYGIAGKILLATLITIACLVAMIGVTTSAASYLSRLTGRSYKSFVYMIALISLIITNLGLTRIIECSIPVLLIIYPIFVLLIFLSPFTQYFRSPMLVGAPAAYLGGVCGVLECLKNAGITRFVPHFYERLPLSHQGLGWLVPCFGLVFFCFVLDKLLYTKGDTAEIAAR